MHTIKLDFEGYWRDAHKKGIPAYSGIYLVYRCTYSSGKDKVSLKELIYIGESENVHDRIQNHDRYEDFIDQLEPGEMLCFACANVDHPDRERAESALIYKYKPILNDMSTEGFNYPPTEIICSGKHAFINDEIVVE